jgi:putative oxidoreductase
MSRINTALLLIRIASAAAFLYHGSAILFGAFGGSGPEQFAAEMHAPVIVGYLVGAGQFFGGLGILVGLFARIAAASVAIIMLGAIFLAHLPHGFDVGKGGFEYALTLLLIALAILSAGPGAFSLSSALPPSLQKL